MCGIVAYIGHREANQVLFEGLSILQNRGYDSAGMATVNSSQELIVTKFASKEKTSDSIDFLKKDLDKHRGNTCGIIHTRWATHGGVNTRNSHPHNDASGRFSLVHNGVIGNHDVIRKFLLSKGIECISETDTEVIVQLIGYYSRENSFKKAIKLALKELEGTWALAILDRTNPNCLIATCHGSPLLLGIGDNEIFLASEVTAFQKYASRYISINNGELVVITNESGNIDLNIEWNHRVRHTEKSEILLSPDPYPHWTLREITLQPQTIQAAINNGSRIYDDQSVILGGLDRNKQRLLSIKNLIIVGCGTSYHAGLYGAHLFRLISGFNSVQVVDASEFNSSYLTSDSGLLCLSQSGETKDVMRCLDLIRDKVMFSVVNQVDSQVARYTNCGVYLNAGREVGVASTKAFTSQVTVLSMISVWFAQHRHISLSERRLLIDNIRMLSSSYYKILQNLQIKNVSEYLKNKNSCFILGKGSAAYIASEGALKIKEIGYIHAEGYPGGSLKHGPFALIEPGTPIIVILLKDADQSYMESTIHEIKSRGAYTIVITNIEDYEGSDIVISIPECGLLSSLLAVVPLQLIAYQLAIIKGINPDVPRNLAKCVTVI